MSGSEDYRVERFQPRHLDALLTIHAAAHGTSRALDELRHKFDTSGFGHPVIGYVAFAQDGSPAAYYGVFPIRVRRDGVTVLAAQSGDTMTHPDHQGRGLFTRLGTLTNEAARAEGIAFVFGFPSANSYPGVRRLGWEFPRTMRSYSMVVPTVPVAELTRRNPTAAAKVRSLQRRLVVATRLARPVTEPRSSVTEAGEAGVVRDDAFLAYKGRDLLTFEQGGTAVDFSFDRFLSIADIRARAGRRPWAALARVALIAVISGSWRVRYHVSPGSSSDVCLRGCLPVKEGLPSGFLALDPTSQPDAYNFTFIDFDTY